MLKHLLKFRSCTTLQVTYFEEFGRTMQQDVAQEAPIGVDSNHQLMAGDAGQWESLQGIHSNGGTAELPAQEEGQHADNWLGAEDGIDHLSEGQDPFVGGDAEETPHVTEGDEHSQEEKSASGEGDLKPIETSKVLSSVEELGQNFKIQFSLLYILPSSVESAYLPGQSYQESSVLPLTVLWSYEPAFASSQTFQ